MHANFNLPCVHVTLLPISCCELHSSNEFQCSPGSSTRALTSFIKAMTGGNPTLATHLVRDLRAANGIIIDGGSGGDASQGSVLYHGVSIEDMVGAKVQVRFIVQYSHTKVGFLPWYLVLSIQISAKDHTQMLHIAT